jgi:hypothetical protein
VKRRGEDFGSVGIGTPYCDGRGHYGFFQSFTWLLVQGCEDDDYYLNTRKIRGDLPIPHIHNDLVREFLLETDADTMVLCEDDHVYDAGVLRRMRNKEENWNFDIVCATYVSRRGRVMPVSWDFVPKPERQEYSIRFSPFNVQRSGTQRYDGSGLGLVMIRRWLLEELLGDSPIEHFQWFYWDGPSSPDVQFYRDAKQAGAILGVDRDNRIGHIGKRTYTFADFEESVDKWLEEHPEAESPSPVNTPQQGIEEV